eukprot:6212992-Pleurochrysis_carterae.AAC.5
MPFNLASDLKLACAWDEKAAALFFRRDWKGAAVSYLAADLRFATATNALIQIVQVRRVSVYARKLKGSLLRIVQSLGCACAHMHAPHMRIGP